MTRGQLPQRAGSLGLNGGGTATAVPPHFSGYDGAGVRDVNQTETFGFHSETIPSLSKNSSRLKRLILRQDRDLEWQDGDVFQDFTDR